MELFYPVKNPIDQQNLFGTTSPMYTALGQKGHPGIDFECPSGTPVYAPCDGGAFYVTDKDGGCGLWLRYPNNQPDVQFTIILWHMYPKDTPNTNNLKGFPYNVPTDGSVTQVKAGDLLGYSDNSGYPIESTGPHLHLGVIPCDNIGGAISPDNGYLGCVNPMPFFNGQYAEDINNPPQIPTPAVIQTATQAVDLIAGNHIATPEVKETLLQEITDLLMKYL